MTDREHDSPGTPDRRGRGDAAETSTVALRMPGLRRVLALVAAALVGGLVGRWLGAPSWLTGGLAAVLAAFCLDRWGPAWLSR